MYLNMRLKIIPLFMHLKLNYINTFTTIHAAAIATIQLSVAPTIPLALF